MSQPFELSPHARGSDPSTLLWVAPGSLDVDRVSRAWARSRLAGVSRISGPWAVAARDPDADEVVLVADPLGTLPLFWARTTSGRLVVDTRLAGLVDRADVDDALDYEAILLDQGSSYLRGPSVAHRTPFVAVSRVPGGHALRVRADGSSRLLRYWDPATLPGPDESLSLPDCADLLRERVEAAVVRLTPTDAPVGSHVSGGLDCTSVAGIAHQTLRAAGGGLVAGYSWAPGADQVPRFDGDERDLLDLVERQRDLPVRTAPPEGDGAWFDQLDPARYPEANHGRECLVLSRARSDGVSVMLSGWGGDELASFNGRTVVPELVRRGRLTTAWREYTAAHATLSSRPTPWTRRARSFAATAAAATAPLQQRLDRRYQARMHRAREVAEALRPHSRLAAELQVANADAFARVRTHREWQLLALTHGHLQRRIGWWHQTGRLMGVEYRYPLLDLGVVEAALRLPWWAFLSQGWTRTAFRLAMEPYLPAPVTWNVQKYEPALYWAPTVEPAERPKVERRRERPGDPQYAHAMKIAIMSRDVGAGRLPADARVTSRPAMAPMV